MTTYEGEAIAACQRWMDRCKQAEAKIERIMAWAIGNCMMCDKTCRTPSGHQILARDDCQEWTPPKEWEVTE